MEDKDRMQIMDDLRAVLDGQFVGRIEPMIHRQYGQMKDSIEKMKEGMYETLEKTRKAMENSVKDELHTFIEKTTQSQNRLLRQQIVEAIEQEIQARINVFLARVEIILNVVRDGVESIKASISDVNSLDGKMREYSNDGYRQTSDSIGRVVEQLNAMHEGIIEEIRAMRTEAQTYQALHPKPGLTHSKRQE